MLLPLRGRVTESEFGIVTPCSALKGRQDPGPGRRGWHWHCRRSSAYSSVRAGPRHRSESAASGSPSESLRSWAAAAALEQQLRPKGRDAVVTSRLRVLRRRQPAPVGGLLRRRRQGQLACRRTVVRTAAMVRSSEGRSIAALRSCDLAASSGSASCPSLVSRQWRRHYSFRNGECWVSTALAN